MFPYIQYLMAKIIVGKRNQIHLLSDLQIVSIGLLEKTENLKYSINIMNNKC